MAVVFTTSGIAATIILARDARTIAKNNVAEEGILSRSWSRRGACDAQNARVASRFEEGVENGTLPADYSTNAHAPRDASCILCGASALN